MTIILSEIILTGFGSFRGRQRFLFPKEPGLYFMRGENRVEPRLGGNGAGKSTIWKALCWVLWGKTADGLKAGDVSTWGVKKGTEVTICFEHQEGDRWMGYGVTRTWKPNSWTMSNLFDAEEVDLTKDVTNPLLTMLRLQFEPFLHSIYMAQRADMFLDLKPEPKAQLFSSVMDLDRWLTYSANASTRASDQDRITRRLESDLAELKGRLSASGTGDLEARAEDWDMKRTVRLAEIEQEHQKALKWSKVAKQAAEDAAANEEKVFADSRSLITKRDVALDLKEAGVRKLRLAEDKLRDLTRDLAHATDHCARIFAGKGCPTCGQRPNADEQLRLEDEAEAAEAEVQNDKQFTQLLVTALANELVKETATFRVLEEKAVHAADQRRQASENLRSRRIAYESEEKALDTLEEEAERLEKDENPFGALLNEKRRGQSKLQDELEDAQARLDQSLEKHALYSFWIRGFKELRLQLISEALDELEIEVNSELMEFGLVGWELRFDVDSETKSGKLSRGFSVSVLSPSNEERVPWESWSGGESQRLRLATQCGLANLIRSRTGCDMPLEVWDEPTEGLSEEGINDLLAALGARAAREQRTIWVVDHRALGYGGFAGTVTVVKDEKGSRVVQATV